MFPARRRSENDVPDPDRWPEAERRQIIQSIGVERLGQRYAQGKVETLTAGYAGREPRSVDLPPDDDIDVDLVCYDGDELTDDEFFRMIVADLDEAFPNEGALWCIADGPMDILIGRDKSFAARFHEE